MALIQRLCICILIVACVCNAQETIIPIGLRAIPPYVMEHADGSISGLEYEIIMEIFKAAGLKPSIRCFPLARLHQSFRSGIIQAAAPVLTQHNVKGYFSDSYITYRNTAFALKSRSIRLLKPEDMKGLRIVAFQTARTVLGPAFKTAVEGNRDYTETTTQLTQVNMLFAGRVDVAVSDERIFRYYIKSSLPSVDTSPAVEAFPIFAPTEYRMVFASRNHAEKFNRGLATIKKNGVYTAILARYASLWEPGERK